MRSSPAENGSAEPNLDIGLGPFMNYINKVDVNNNGIVSESD